MSLHRLPLAAAIVALAACSPSHGAGESGGAVPAAIGPGLVHSALFSRSWIRPNAKQLETLLYVTNGGSESVTIYSYQNGQNITLEGGLFGFQEIQGMCLDKKGDVFVVDFAGSVKEYAHGTVTPLATLAVTQGSPYDCAVDPKTGDLAVTTVYGPSYSAGSVLVYPPSLGAPAVYSVPGMTHPNFCTFDAKGNLYVDGLDSNFVSGVFGVLPRGGSAFTRLTVSGGSFTYMGNILALGSELLIGNIYSPVGIYEVTVSGSTATIVGSFSTSGISALGQFAYDATGSQPKIVAPDYQGGDLKIFAFPGGSVLATITDGISYPIAAVLSQGRQ